MEARQVYLFIIYIAQMTIIYKEKCKKCQCGNIPVHTFEYKAEANRKVLTPDLE